MDLANAPGAGVLGYAPEYNPDRRRWFVDVAFDADATYWPFVRLAVARYQPNAIAHTGLSPITLCDYVQVPPSRTLTVTRPGADTIRFVLTGAIGLPRMNRAGNLRGGQVAGALLDAQGAPTDEGGGLPAAATELLGIDAADQQWRKIIGAQRAVIVRLERYLPSVGGDLAWEVVQTQRLTPLVLEGTVVTWFGEMMLVQPLPVRRPDTTLVGTSPPNAGQQWRVTVTERELIEADPSTDNAVLRYRQHPRLVFADTVVL